MKETVFQDGNFKTAWGMDFMSMVPWFVAEAGAELLLKGDLRLAGQMDRLWIVKESLTSRLRLNGSRAIMSFPAHPMPHSSIEELKKSGLYTMKGKS